MDGAAVVVVLGGGGDGASAGLSEGASAGAAEGAAGSPAGALSGTSAGASAAERVRELLDAFPDARLVICDVAALVRPGPDDLDRLGRLRLAARRRGCGLVLRNAGAGLRSLLELTGLDEVFVCEAEAAAGGGFGADSGSGAMERAP